MTILAAEAAEAITAGSAAEGAAGAGAARGTAAARKAIPAAPRGAARKPQAGGRAKLHQAAGKAATRTTAHAKRSVGKGLEIPRFPLTGKGGNAHKVVVAEFILCVFLIGLTPIFMKDPKNGKLYTPNDFVRLTAVSLLFFVLALMSNSPKSSRVAAAFGALVTLGVLYNASQTLTAIGNIFTNQQRNKDSLQAAAAGTQTQIPDLTEVPGGSIAEGADAIAKGAQALANQASQGAGGAATGGIGGAGAGLPPANPGSPNKQGLL